MVFFKRGALAPEQIAILILAIVGFALAALFLFGVFDNKELSERELCKLSILSRATISGIVQNVAPLNCFTEKICLTPKKSFLNSFGGSEKSACRQFAGETNVRAVEVVVDGNIAHQKESANIIQREVANAMFDCWAMTGEGKLNIWGSGEGIDLKKLTSGIFKTIGLTMEEIKPHCIVCSRVAFSDDFFKGDKEDLANKEAILSQINFNSFFSREKIPGSSLTYLQAFTDESVGSGLLVDPKMNNNILTQTYGKKDLTDEELNKVREYYSANINQIPEDERENFNEELNDDAKFKEYISNRPLPLPSSQIAIVFAQIKVLNEDPNEIFWRTMAKGATLGGVGLAGGADTVISLIPLSKVPKAVVEIMAVGTVATTLAFKAKGITVANQALSAATCNSIDSKDKNLNGCSFVKLVDWNSENINQLCTGGIEGNL